MFRIFSVLLLGIVEIESEQMQCVLKPVKRENVLMGYCCMISEDISREQFQERIEEIFDKDYVNNNELRTHHNSGDNTHKSPIQFPVSDEKVTTANGTQIPIGNRDNIDSPTECNDSTQKTSSGLCEEQFR